MVKKLFNIFRDGLKGGKAPEGVEPIPTGYHNSKLIRGNSYLNKSTAIFTPSRAAIRQEVVNSWLNLMQPMNHKVNRLMITEAEVGVAYNTGFQIILNHEAYRSSAYVLCLEDDNVIPEDALLRLIETIDGRVDGNKYDVVGGLYWSHDVEGIPYCMGSDELFDGGFNSVPLNPLPDKEIVPCHVVGMGCCLIRMDFLRKMEYPYFETREWFDATKPLFDAKTAISQDGTFFKTVHAMGGKVACDTRVKVGHIDRETGFIW